MAKKGRPSKYSDELADQICELIATTERGLHSICRDFDITATSVLKWLSENKIFSDNYARAKELQAEFMAQQILAIADETSNDTIITENGAVPNSEWISRSRLRVDSRKWLASKLAPKKYGDKVDVTSGGDKIESNPIMIVTVDTAAKKSIESIRKIKK